MDAFRTESIDITDRKRVEEVLRDADRWQSEFLAALGHDLRSPLNAILGWTHLLRSGNLPPDSATRALNTIERNARDQAQLISDLLDVASIQGGKFSLVKELSPLGAVVQAACDNALPVAREADIDLTWQVEPGLAPVLGDRQRLEQALGNLLRNAVKATPGGGRIEVRAERLPPASLQIQVRDSGDGIAVEALPHVFDRLWQAGARANAVPGGLGRGLGLAISRHIAERHGGTLTVDSAGAGKGSTFILVLPEEIAVAEDATPGLREDDPGRG